MKRILFFATLLFCAYTVSAKQNVTITGTTTGTAPITIGKMVDGKLQDITELKPANGKFTYNASIDEPEIYFITTPFGDATLRSPMVAENGTITVAVSAENKTIQIGGTELNKKLQKYNEQQSASAKESIELRKVYMAQKEDGTLTKESEEKIMEQVKLLGDKDAANSYNFAKENINNVAGLFVFGSNASRLPLEQQKEIVALANKTTLQQPTMQKITNYMAALDRVAIGQPFVDFRLPNLDGKEVALSDYTGKGKYVMIDFWASWCGPCRMEMPNFVKAYELYKDKGLEIVGVSLDKDKESWQKGTTALGITWPQMSDLKYWSSEAAALYAVKGIPHTVLIDPNGKIIAKNLRGEELMEKLEELLGK